MAAMAGTVIALDGVMSAPGTFYPDEFPNEPPHGRAHMALREVLLSFIAGVGVIALALWIGSMVLLVVGR